MGIDASQRFSDTMRCPVCNGSSTDEKGIGQRCWGYYSRDRTYAYCMRPEWAGIIKPNEKSFGSYAHRLDAPCFCGNDHGTGRPIAPTRYPISPQFEDHPKEKKRVYFNWTHPVATYHYVDQDGVLVAIKERIEGYDDEKKMHKVFRWKRPNGDKGLNGVQPPLYRIDRLVRSDPAMLVYVTEGEKCVHYLEERGLLTVCSPHGSSHRPVDISAFTQRMVCLLPDRDDDDQLGLRYMQWFAENLVHVASSVKLVDLGLAHNKDDIIDWLEGGHALEELAQKVEEAPLWISPTVNAYRVWARAVREKGGK